MHIGELARSAQVNVQTIRFYERQGLLPRPQRSSTGYRIYEAHDLERLIFIKRNQNLGFTLAEISDLLNIHRTMAGMRGPKRRESKEVQSIIAMGRVRLRTINEKIRTLHDMRRNLNSVVTPSRNKASRDLPGFKSPARKGLKEI